MLLVGGKVCRSSEFWRTKPGEVAWVLRAYMDTNGSNGQAGKVEEWKSALAEARAHESGEEGRNGTS